MATYELRTFGDLVTAVREELKIQAGDTTSINRIKRNINIVYLNEIVPAHRWWWARGNVTLQQRAYLSTGTVAVVANSNEITFSTGPGASRKGHLITFDGHGEVYRIESHTAASTTARLAVPFTGTTNAEISYKVWTDRVPLPTDCRETEEIWHDYSAKSLDAIGMQEFRRKVAISPKAEGRPIFYATGEYADHTIYTDISGLPAVSTRASAGVVKTIVFASSIADYIEAGDRLEIANSGHYSYNGEIVAATVDEDTLTYVSYAEHQEAAVADATMTVKSIVSETEYERQRELYLYPSLLDKHTSIHVDYIKDIPALINDNDEPMIPIHDRVVLLYGALASSWARERNPEEALRNESKYQQKLNKMAGKIQDSMDRPVIRVSTNYLANKRQAQRQRTLGQSPITFGGGGGGAGGAITSTANRAATFDGTGELTASTSITTTELDFLDGVSSNIQTQLDGKVDDADLAAHLADGIDAHTASAITNIPSGNLAATEVQAALDELQTDVDTRATSASVTTVSDNLAAHIADATDAHAATAITNTPSGNLAATTVQAALNELQSDVDTRDTTASVSARFDPTTGHDHDGVDSKKVLATNLDATGGTTGQVLKVSSGGAPEWGAGAGSGGINFLGLNTSWQLATSDDRDAEASIGNWAAYADAAATSPVDGTGGSPTVSIARTTTVGEVLNGAGSFELTKDAANRQGEGVACVANIPLAYRNSRCMIRFAYKVTSGTVADGDITGFIGDVTNGTIITPFQVSKISNSQGIYRAYFDPASTTAQIRLILHVASTSAVAYTIAFDDVEVTPNTVVSSAPSSDWTNESTVTTQGFGTPTHDIISWRREGPDMILHVRFTTGTCTAVEAQFGIPGGRAVATGYSNPPIVGYGSVNGGIQSMFTVLATAGDTFVNFSPAEDASSTILSPTTGSTLSSNTTAVSFFARIPIQGWSSNVQSAESSTFRISDFAANAGRVTSTPTALGQYRSYLRQASAITYTETNGSPTDTPSAANGFRIYNGNAWAVADTANNPTRYEIFVGKNKQVKAEWYATTGRTGVVNANALTTGTTDFGYNVSYDPATGIVTIVSTHVSAGNRTAHSSGTDASGSTAVNDIYFDIIVSENVLAVGAQSMRSSVRLDSHAGYGSTDTKIPYFTNSAVTGTALTLTTNNATSGASITVNEDGIYSFAFSADSANNARAVATITANETSPITTDATSLANSLVLQRAYSAAVAALDACAFTSWTGFLSAGTVVRPHTNAGVPSTTAHTLFTGCKVNL